MLSVKNQNKHLQWQAAGPHRYANDYAYCSQISPIIRAIPQPKNLAFKQMAV
jgi:hypothetical protein